ncbi:unnamed protein product [Heterobilharzia americana]|nr:unnamed protein product [Heterobilharzia americana]
MLVRYVKHLDKNDHWEIMGCNHCVHQSVESSWASEIVTTPDMVDSQTTSTGASTIQGVHRFWATPKTKSHRFEETTILKSFSPHISRQH